MSHGFQHKVFGFSSAYCGDSIQIINVQNKDTTSYQSSLYNYGYGSTGYGCGNYGYGGYGFNFSFGHCHGWHDVQRTRMKYEFLGNTINSLMQGVVAYLGMKNPKFLEIMMNMGLNVNNGINPMHTTNPYLNTTNQNISKINGLTTKIDDLCKKVNDKSITKEEAEAEKAKLQKEIDDIKKEQNLMDRTYLANQTALKALGDKLNALDTSKLAPKNSEKSSEDAPTNPDEKDSKVSAKEKPESTPTNNYDKDIRTLTRWVNDFITDNNNNVFNTKDDFEEKLNELESKIDEILENDDPEPTEAQKDNLTKLKEKLEDVEFKPKSNSANSDNDEAGNVDGAASAQAVAEALNGDIKEFSCNTKANGVADADREYRVENLGNNLVVTKGRNGNPPTQIQFRTREGNEVILTNPQINGDKIIYNVSGRNAGSKWNVSPEQNQTAEVTIKDGKISIVFSERLFTRKRTSSKPVYDEKTDPVLESMRKKGLNVDSAPQNPTEFKPYDWSQPPNSEPNKWR